MLVMNGRIQTQIIIARYAKLKTLLEISKVKLRGFRKSASSLERYFLQLLRPGNCKMLSFIKTYTKFADSS